MSDRSLPFKLAFFLILLACFAGTAQASATPPASGVEAGTFSIFIAKPAEGDIVNNNLSIAVTVASTFELSSVKAQVDGREVSLAFSNTAICAAGGSSCTPGWAGVLSLAGLTRGAKTLIVKATDVFGSTGQAQRNLTYDLPPSVNVTAPIAETVTGLTLRVKADCMDDDPAGCKSMKVTYSYPIPAPGTSGTVLSVSGSSIDENVTLPTKIQQFSSDGQPLFLTITGMDSAGQSSGESRVIYVQQHSRLIEVESFNGRILDAQPDRVLLLENPGRADNVLKIRMRSTGEEAVIPLAGKVVKTAIASPGGAGFLSPKGAVFAATDEPTSSSNGRVYDWRDGTLVALDELFTDPIANAGLKVRGDYALFDTFDQTASSPSSSPSLRLRNLVSGTTTEVAKVRSGDGSADLAANGDVVYTLWQGRDAQGRDLYNIFRYRNGATSQLTDDAQDFINVSPVTDGINVVYQRQSRNSESDHTLTLIDSTGARSDLSVMPHAFSFNQYQTAGGWVAFQKPGGGGVLQVWTRSPAADFRQVSFFGTDSNLGRLGSNGELTFSSASAPTFGASVRLYLHRAGEPPVDVSATGPVTFSVGGQWYAFLGRTLFRLPTTAEVSPVLIADADTGRALALDSVTHTRDPFDFSTPYNFSADHRTRVLLFASNVDWMSVSANSPVTARAEDSAHNVFPLTVEYAAPDKNINWLTAVVVRLPDEFGGGGDFLVTINVGGFDSNQARISVTNPAAATP